MQERLQENLFEGRRIEFPREPLRLSKESILYDTREYPHEKKKKKRLRARQDDNGNQFYLILL